MGSGGDRKYEEYSDIVEGFPYRCWYTWTTAKTWPLHSVVLCRYLLNSEHGAKYGYSLITDFQPDAQPVEGTDYLFIDLGNK